MTQPLLFFLLTFFASAMGTATGFGTSTIMLPVLTLFMPVPVALLFVGLIHLAGDIWKVLLFKKGFAWNLILGFGLAGIFASFLGATLSLQAPDLPYKRMLGIFLVLYVIFLLIKREWSLPENGITAVCGGLLSGLFAGFFGVGGAVRGAFLAAFNLPKEVYIFTSGLIALFIDITRVTRYLWGGTRLADPLFYVVLACIPISFSGAYLAKRFLQKMPQRYFRIFIAIFLALVGIILIVQS